MVPALLPPDPESGLEVVEEEEEGDEVLC